MQIGEENRDDQIGDGGHWTVTMVLALASRTHPLSSACNRRYTAPPFHQVDLPITPRKTHCTVQIAVSSTSKITPTRQDNRRDDIR